MKNKIMFGLTPRQLLKANKFVSAHSCDLPYAGAVGGKITYSFTNTSLGQIILISCACGADVDLSDYDIW